MTAPNNAFRLNPKGTPATRFWRKVDRRGPDDCWLWTGAKWNTGYGSMNVDGKQRGAHRLSYELHSGEIPAGLFVCHRCDTPACVNPAHLFLGTPADNARDALHKGRLKINLRVSDAQVEDIRRERRDAGTSLRKIAARYGVSHVAISKILSGLKRKEPLAGIYANA